MLKKKNRLSNPRINSINSFATKHFILKMGYNDLGKLRVAINVSKKIDKKAVVRNKIKRTLADLLYDRVKKLKKGLDLVFIAKKEMLHSNKEEIKKEIESIFTKI
ncbi:MAG: Ribonuclease P protein component [Candidatus Levybacteria bacterium GW2011_GWA2_36_13]|nr:MAG: Ribonuclease P protein component [Candidatus Levybacteria bacterium GW2011_GWA2_36_13]KKP98827.1 MAG: Ribonuclease P protein component [Candidatus Levybacteria bacterium GW2011_GWB1_36_18]OGH43541.1 MAG: ribonuclease P protein component [Candidatus Levybacteria bacterium RIFCSPLOWO2_02_FULL_37_11]HJZ18618.1 ribonuclease P protein component [Candidatus Nanoarchaeia archaeon]